MRHSLKATFVAMVLASRGGLETTTRYVGRTWVDPVTADEAEASARGDLLDTALRDLDPFRVAHDFVDRHQSRCLRDQ
jgi:hypothetical protein